MVLNFLIATLEARRQWNNLFSMMRENGFYWAKLSVKYM
jgi:hypothetical protein